MAFSNEYLLLVDIKRRLSSVVPSFKQGDNGVLKFEIYDNGKKYDLSDYTYSEITFRLPSGTSIVGNPTLDSKGVLTYSFTGVEMSEVGKIEAILSIYSGSTMVSIQPFFCFIYDSMKGEDLSYIGILQDLIAEVQILRTEVTETVEDVTEVLAEANVIKEEVSNLNKLVTAQEQIRDSNETKRKSNEVTRVNNENTRISNENTRISKEQVRETNEAERLKSLASMNTIIDQFKTTGTYNANVMYKKFNQVEFNGNTYIALVDNAGVPVTNTDAWRLYAKKGDKGDKGDTGAALRIMGSLTNESQLPSSGQAGDAYSINGELYVWSENTNVWVNVGNVKGEKGDQGDVTQVEMGISQFNLVTDTISQTSWKIPMTTFNPLKDTIIVIRNTTTLTPDMYDIETKSDGIYVTLKITPIQEISDNNLSIIIFKAKAVIPDTTFDGSLLTNETVTLPKLSAEIQNSLTNVDTIISEITEQLADVNTNNDLKTEVNETPNLSDEMRTSATVILGTGWTGNVTDGFTHTSGNSDALSIELPFISEQIYQIEINHTNPAVIDNGQSDYWFSLAGSPEFETYKGRTTRHVWGVKAISGNKLIIRPWENYAGTIKISIKQVIGGIEPYNYFRDSSGVVSTERRLSARAVASIYYGLHSGRYSNEFAEQNVAIGNGSQRNNTSGFWNASLGHETLRDNTVGSRNVAIGRIALAQNISGDRNVAVGSWALTRNTTGRSNIGIGADALYYNTAGNFNVGIGLVALGQNPSGNNNIGIGERTMSGSVGGQHNTALGRNVLYNNKGDDNFGVGNQALYRNTTGLNNTAIGNHANFLNEVSDNNIAIGNQALYQNTAGNNIALGYRSLRFNSTGIHNISMGNQTLTTHTSGNYNIALGNSSLSKLTLGGSNVAVGGSTLSTMTNGDGNVAIGQGSMQNTVGISNRNVSIGRNSGIGLGSGDFNIFLGASTGSSANNGNSNIVIGYNVQKMSSQANNQLNIGNIIKSADMTSGVVEMQKLKLTSLPTTLPAETGIIWNDGGTLKIS